MNQQIEDVEREHLKDGIYIIEKQIQDEIDFWQWWENEHKLPAKIEIINKIPKENVNNSIKHLPF